MICSNCGTMLADGLKFCSECGANLSDPEDRASSSRKPPEYQEPTDEESWYEDSSYQAKKPAARRPPPEPSYDYQEEAEPQRIVIEHARKRGDDISTSFGRGFGDTIGRKAGGCAWSLIVIGAIIFLILIFALTMR